MCGDESYRVCRRVGPLGGPPSARAFSKGDSVTTLLFCPYSEAFERTAQFWQFEFRGNRSDQACFRDPDEFDSSRRHTLHA